MWPIMLDMTRDECRGILRRLELETYSNVMSTFRAQGGLNDKKRKMLEELRTYFHISVDRHRAEARRVANDEQLCTISEMLSGRDMVNEWSKEGRRPFPLLPRGTAFTALSILADKACEAATQNNDTLPLPADTRREIIMPTVEDDIQKVILKDLSQPVKDSKCFKRPLSQPKDAPLAKKRGEILQTKQNHIHTNVRIQQLYKKCTVAQTKPRKATPSKRGKGRISMGRTPKTERKSKEKVVASTTQPTYTTSPIKPEKPPINVSQPQEYVGGSSAVIAATTPISIQSPPISVVHQTSTATAVSDGGHIFVPQIATSKKDIASNLTKLISNTPQPITVATYNSSQHVGVLNPGDGATPTKTTQSLNNIIQTTVGVQQKPQQIIKMIPAQNIKISNNILQKSLSGKILSSSLDTSSLPIGAKINLQLHPNTSSSSLPSKPNAPSIVAPHTVSITQPLIHQHQLTAAEQTSYKVINPTTPTKSLTVGGHHQHHHHHHHHQPHENITQISQKLAPRQQQHQHVNVKNNYKVQILSQQILQSPITNKTSTTSLSSATTAATTTTIGGGGNTTSVKLASNNVALKTLQPKTQIKLIPSPTGIGKVLLKSSSTGNKITGITQLKGVTTNATNSPMDNIKSIQKVQLMPIGTSQIITGSFGPSSSSGQSKTSGGVGSSSDQITKPTNMILMHKLNQMTTSNSSTNPLRGVKISKEMNKIIMNTKNVAPIKTNYVSHQQNNVIVLGISEVMSANKSTILMSDNQNQLSKSSVITEDTPVDIIQSLPSPTSTVSEIIINGGNIDGKEGATTDVATHVNQSNANKTNTSNVRKNVDQNASKEMQEDESRDNEKDGEPSTTTVETITDWEMELDQANQANNTLRHSTGVSSKNNATTENNESIIEQQKTSNDEDLQNMLQDGIEETETTENEVNHCSSMEEGYDSSPEDRLDGKLIFEISNEEDYIEEDHTIYEDQQSVATNSQDEEDEDGIEKGQIIAVDSVEALISEMHSVEVLDGDNSTKSNVMTIDELIASGGQIITAENINTD